VTNVVKCWDWALASIKNDADKKKKEEEAKKLKEDPQKKSDVV
jgi:hypothetical protein